MIRKNYYYNFFFIILILLAYYRSPYIFNNGRFFSLDLAYHLKIQSLTLIESIFFIDFSARYLNLISNISSIISSRFFDLENAQYVAVYLSLTIYLIIFYYILYKESQLFISKYQKCFATLICLLAPVMSFEIWLNAINLQIYLGLLTTIIFFLKPVNQNKNLNYFLLILGGLSGIYSCILTPFFLIKYLNNKDRYNFNCFLILCLSSIIQIYIIYISIDYNLIGSHNTSLALIFTKYEAISYFYNIFVRAFFGSTFPKYISNFFELDLKIVFNYENIKNILFFISIFSISIFIIAFYMTIKTIKKKEDKIIMLNLSVLFVLLSLIILIGGVSDSVHGRYSSLPGLVIVFLILYLFEKSEKTLIKIFSIALICCSLFFGLLDYRLKNYIVYLDCLGCPDWKEEVRNYKENSNYKLNAWPYHIDR